MNINRRGFLVGTALAGATLAGGCVSSAYKGTRTRRPGERPTVAVIGMGMQGRHLLHQFLGQDVVVRVVCDVDKTRAANGAKLSNDYYASRPALGIASDACRACGDFREILSDSGIDMVCVAAPDHWHAYMAVEAMKAGKDVYCEKPLTYSIDEAKILMRVAEKTGRVVQTGAMQRSGTEFRTAAMLCRNGAIGKIRFVDCNYGNADGSRLMGGPSQPHRFFLDASKAAEESAPNPDVDWDLWLGGAPWTPYSSELSPRGVHKKYHMFWRFDDYFGSGYNGDWGAHHLDIAQWGLGMDGSGPVKVVCSSVPHSPNPIHGGRRQYGMEFVFADGCTIRHNPFSNWGTVFYGTDGVVAVNRGKFAFWRGKGAMPDAAMRRALEDGSFDGMELVSLWYPGKDGVPGSARCGKSLAAAFNRATKECGLKTAPVQLYKSFNHVSDFVARFLDRGKPCSHAEIGARSAILCHLCNLSYIYDSGFDWDPAANTFANGTGDPDWLKRAVYRNDWDVKA